MLLFVPRFEGCRKLPASRPATPLLLLAATGVWFVIGPAPVRAQMDRPAGSPTEENAAPLQPEPPQMERWIDQLKSLRFSERQKAQRQLEKLSEQVVGRLEEVARTSPDAEQQYRAERAARKIRRRVLWKGFTTLAQQSEGDLDVEEAMWWICRIGDFHCDRQPVTDTLDELADRVRRQLGPGPDPAARAPREVVEAFQVALFQDFGLKGAVARYDHPDNSLIHRVLQRREGLPILLSHVVVAVADRLDVPIVGLAIPGRYMVKYNGQQAPPGFPQDDIILDPFGGGQLLTIEQLQARIPRVTVPDDLQPDSGRATVTRMLRNLASDYAVLEDFDRASLVAGFVALMEDQEELP